MKIQRKISPTTIIEAEGDTLVDVFERLASLEEIFHGYETCGLCKKSNVAYQARQDKEGNKYYQAHCLDCRAEFRFGVKKVPKGALFPQKKDAQGNWKPDGGWAKWEGKKQTEPAPDNRQYDEDGSNVPF